MFDLEKTIVRWRQQMLTAGIPSPVPLKELENHLREEIEHLIKSGSTIERAFEIAADNLGQPQTLNWEFRKNERNIMKRIIFITAGVLGILIGPGFILPALAKHRNLGFWDPEIIGFVILGSVIALAGIGATIYGFKRQKA